jgi:hypothetical protein
MSSLTSIDIVRYLVLPILIGLIGGILSAFVSYIKEKAETRQQNRIMQVEKAIEVCTKIIESLDVLYSHMRSDVWDIAWRKTMMEKGSNKAFPQSLIELDQAKWNAYLACLDEWRHHEITYETELMAYFGNDGYEAFLFREVDNKIEQTSDIVWKIYYGSENSTTPINYKAKKGGNHQLAPVDMQSNHAMAMSQLQGMKMEFFEVVAEMREQIATLSSTMIKCIQAQNIGNLAKSVVPMPESANDQQEESEALLVNTKSEAALSGKKKKYENDLEEAAEV